MTALLLTHHATTLSPPLPASTVAIEAVSEWRLELDELMLLSAVTTAEFPLEQGKKAGRARKKVTLHAASADAELLLEPGQTGSAFRADGPRVGPVNRGRRSVPSGVFAITRG